MTKDSLGNIINNCADLLRTDDGISGSVHYTEVLAWIMFLKFMNDKEEELATEAELEFEDYQYLIDEEFRWANWATKKELTGQKLIGFVNECLIPYFAALKGESPTDRREVIAAIFKEVTNRVHSGYILKDVLLKINEIQFNSTDDIHTLSFLYESLLQKMGDDGGNSGEFYTPRPVVRFMVEMIDPQINGTVFDPASGSCGFLVEAYDYMKQEADTPDKVKQLAENTFYGQEKTPLAYLLGLMNMLLHGIDYPRLSKINTLTKNIREIDERDKHTYILANPPFGGKEQKMIQKNFPVEAQATELLFLQYIMKSLAFDGKAAVVVPEGVLFRTNGAYKSVKTELLEKFNVHSIVSLPPGVFLPYSAVKTSIIFFERNTATRDIWFYEVPLVDGKRLTKNHGISKDHFCEVSNLLKERIETEHSWLVSVDQVIKNGTNLSASKYNPHQEEEEELLEPDEYAEEVLGLLQSALEDIKRLMGSTGEIEND